MQNWIFKKFRAQILKNWIFQKFRAPIFFYPRGPRGYLINPWGPRGPIKNTFKNKVKINIYPFFGETFEAPPNGIRLECRIQKGALEHFLVIRPDFADLVGFAMWGISKSEVLIGIYIWILLIPYL